MTHFVATFSETDLVLGHCVKSIGVFLLFSQENWFSQQNQKYPYVPHLKAAFFKQGIFQNRSSSAYVQDYSFNSIGL